MTKNKSNHFAGLHNVVPRMRFRRILALYNYAKIQDSIS